MFLLLFSSSSWLKAGEPKGPSFPLRLVWVNSARQHGVLPLASSRETNVVYVASRDSRAISMTSRHRGALCSTLSRIPPQLTSDMPANFLTMCCQGYARTARSPPFVEVKSSRPDVIQLTWRAAWRTNSCVCFGGRSVHSIFSIWHHASRGKYRFSLWFSKMF